MARKRYVLSTTYAAMLEAGDWAEIPGCPGRLKLRGGHETPPADLVGAGVEVTVHTSPHAPDPVHVARFRGGGLISFARADGTWVHTLNTPEGLARKLAQLEIA